MGILSGLRRLLSRQSAASALPADRCSIVPGGVTRADLVEESFVIGPQMTATEVRGRLEAGDVRQRFVAALADAHARELPDGLQLTEADMAEPIPGTKPPHKAAPRTRNGSRPAKMAAKKAKR